jgi:hypothetical protein
MTSQTGNDATNLFVDHGLLLVFNTRLLSTVYRSLPIGVFCEVNNGRLSISAARGRGRPKVKSPFDSSTMVSY